MNEESNIFTFIPINWITKARCRGMDPNIFMPELGAPTEPIKEICNGKQIRVFNRARQVFETVGDPPCPVREQCLNYALELPGKVVGIFGGTSEKERRAIKSSMRKGEILKRSRQQMRTRIKHGTYAGYRAEKRLQLPVCEACTYAYHQEKQQHLKKTTRNEQDAPLKQLITLIHSVTTEKWPIAKDIADESIL